MNTLESITRYFPAWLQTAANAASFKQPEEFCLRAGQKPTAFYAGREHSIASRLLTPQELEQILLCAARYSRYAVTDQISGGYLTLSGGHRIGICGTAVVRDGQIVSMKELSSLCIRIARDHSAEFDLSCVLTDASTLIVGQAGSGKTTLLRAVLKKLSDAGSRVGVCDCRGEIAAVQQGVAQFPVGTHTDVISGTSMAQGLLMLLRTMRPEWLCADEITAEEDIRAMELCAYLGAKILATAHAGAVSDLQKRPLYRKLIARGIFSQVILISPDRTLHAERISQCSD